MMKAGRYHLITERGFFLPFFATVAVLSILVAGLHQCTTSFAFAVDAVAHESLFKLVAIANSLESNILLGLLSSSCCAIQLLLGMFSFGCAGFNTVIGPFRPFLLATTVVLQVWSYCVARLNPAFRWKQAAASTATCMCLALLPEMLYLIARLQDRSQLRAGNTVVLAVKGLGCIACATTVTNAAVKAHAKVVSAHVNMEQETVELRMSSTKGEKIGADGFNEEVVEAVCGALTRAGFPSKKMSSNKVGDDNINTNETDGREKIGANATLETSSCVAAGLLSSSCCAVQLGLNLLSSLNVIHVGCAGFNKHLGGWRPHARLATGAWLVGLWVHTLRRRLPKRRLLLNTVAAVTLAFLPEMLRHGAGVSVAPPTDAMTRMTFSVEGMGCEACEASVRAVFEKSPGVITVDALDYETGRAEVLVADGWGFEFNDVRDTLEMDGYNLFQRDGEKGGAVNSGKALDEGAGGTESASVDSLKTR